MKVAIIHPWFLEAGGGERVAGIIAGMYPEADLFTFAYDSKFLPPELRERRIVVSPLSKIMLHGGPLRNYLFPLFPWAIESFDVSNYDLVISSCPPLMGVNVRQDAVHVCYCHTTQHSWWDQYAQHQKRLSPFKRAAFVWASSFHRMWEFSAAQRLDALAVNSHYIERRAYKYFRRQGTVIYPPINTDMGYISESISDYYLTVSRLTASKRIDLLIEACNRLGRQLWIVGTGRNEGALRAIAGDTIKFLGHVPDADLPDIYAHARAFLFASDEDFGMAPVEAQAFGRPVIAYGHGGSLETVRVGDTSGSSDTGLFFQTQSADSVVEAILRFEKSESDFIPGDIRTHAQTFDTSAFVDHFSNLVRRALRT